MSHELLVKQLGINQVATFIASATEKSLIHAFGVNIFIMMHYLVMWLYC